MNKFTLLLISFIFSCVNLFSQEKLFKLLPPDSTGVDFINIVKDTKHLNVISYEYYYNGSGVAIGDINNDGLPDLFFTSNVFENRLYLNQGNLKFKDISKKAGIGGSGFYHTGVVMVDINNDGWMDIYVCQSVAAEHALRKNVLYVNNHDGTFTDRAAEYGIADEGYSTQAAFNDMDGDGDLDLLVLNHPFNLDFAKTVHLAYNSKRILEAVKDPPTVYESDRYYENVNGKFIDRTVSAGLETRAFGLSTILQDFNNDGKPDIYQANDYLEPDYLFINKGGNKFVNEFDKFFKHCSYSSMGSDYADLNNDGLSDLITVDMLPEINQRQKQLRRGNNYDEFEKFVKYGYGHQYVKNVLQLNNGNGSYSDVSYFTGMAFTDWSWAVLINDFDNDGFKDVYINNGYMRDITDMDYSKFYMDSIKKELIKAKSDTDVVNLLSLIPSVKVQKYYFKNYGGLNFKKESKEAGMNQFGWSFGAAYGDLDNDGDLDVVVCNNNDYAFIYKNNTADSKVTNSLRIQLAGPPQNINGIGAKIETVTADSLKTMCVFNPMKGYLSSHDKTTIIGIGKNKSADVTVAWPDGKKQNLKNVSSGQLKIISYKEAAAVQHNADPVKLLFSDITNRTKIDYIYNENEYIDFKLEPLLPHRFSQFGPCLAVADFNGDKRQDVFIGGAKGFSAKMYFQNSDETFSLVNESAFEADKMFEDGAVAVLDLDRDGDNDLIVTSGGNEYPNQATSYPIRFYLNGGSGVFKRDEFPNNNFLTSSNVIAIDDYNKDGKDDIFIGGRVVPGHYGLIPQSILLNRKSDSLINVAGPKLNKIGMVTSAVWVDIDNDGWDDLVLAGEWMAITFFLNINGTLSDEPLIIPNTFGWWSKLVIADLNNDGYKDIICGNLGMNTRYRGTVDKPVSMVVSDFDNNGSTDCLISVFVKDKSYPIAIRDYVLDQMPYLRKKYLRYKPYSTATIQDIFSESQLKAADNFVANEMHSCVFMNQGNKNFNVIYLPSEAQLFPVNGIQVDDINGDHIPDLLLAGNDYTTEVETGRNDAGIGLYLTGKGDGTFTPIPVLQSGFYTPGNVKSLEKITIGSQPSYLVGKNNDRLQILQAIK